MLENPTTWVAVSFVIFIGLVWWKGRAGISQSLSAKIADIRAEIESAEQLRLSAKEALSQASRQQKEATEQAEDIRTHAREDVAQLKKTMARRLKEVTERHKNQASESIARAERDAIASLRAELALLSVEAARDLISKDLQKGPDPMIAPVIAKGLSKLASGKSDH